MSCYVTAHPILQGFTPYASDFKHIMDNFKTKDNLKLWFVNKSLKMLTKNNPSHCQRHFAHLELWEGCYMESKLLVKYAG